jgi:hypothetical protein
MLNNVMYSIRMHLRNDPFVITESVKTRTGAMTIDNEPMPFILVQTLNNNNTIIAAGRRDFAEKRVFQVSLYSKTVHGMNKLTEQVINSLRKPVQLYNTDIEPPLPGGFFGVHVVSAVPIYGESASRETDYNRMHLTVEVDFYHNTTTGGYTQ